MIFSGRLLLTVIVTIISSANTCNFRSDDKSYNRILTDACGRTVHVPDTIRSVIALKPGALRLLCYMDLADKISYIEGNEKRRFVPYLFANPELKELTIIGTGNNHDTELLSASKADLIVVTFMTCSEADKLQKLSGKPVVALNYGDLDGRKDDLFSSLILLGKLFNREERADSITNYIKSTIDDFNSRTSAYNPNSVSAYVGGVAFSGSHGITSTVPGYPPFKIASAANAAGSLAGILESSGNSRSNTVIVIDAEQLIQWDPDYLFLDVSGKPIWQKEIEKPVFYETLTAIRNLQVYTVLPYNWYTINYENLLCNTWFIGKTIYPGAFSDINVEEKCREIYKFFLGRDIFDEMINLYNPYNPVFNRS